jgi:hypothetical protein
MILAPQQRFSVGEQLRRILRLRASATPSSMRNQIEFSAIGVDISGPESERKRISLAQQPIVYLPGTVNADPL